MFSPSTLFPKNIFSKCKFCCPFLFLNTCILNWKFLCLFLCYIRHSGHILIKSSIGTDRPPLLRVKLIITRIWQTTVLWAFIRILLFALRNACPLMTFCNKMVCFPPYLSSILLQSPESDKLGVISPILDLPT